MRCRKCGRKIDKDSRYCIWCGSFVPEQKQCPGCSTVINKTQKECPSCGRKNTIYDPYTSTLAGKYHRFDRAFMKASLPVIAVIMIGMLLLLAAFIFLLNNG